LISRATIGTIHLNDTRTLSTQKLRESHAVTTGALDTVGPHSSLSLSPIVQLLVALRIGTDAQLAESSTLLVNGHCDVLIFVGINANSDAVTQLIRCCCL
jgi:hypothetical protein